MDEAVENLSDSELQPAVRARTTTLESQILNLESRLEEARQEIKMLHEEREQHEDSRTVNPFSSSYVAEDGDGIGGPLAVGG